METTEVLYYKWCLWNRARLKTEDYIMIRTINADWLVYCKVEQWSKHEDLHGGILGPAIEAGIRTVPVKREEMEKI